MTVHSDMVLKDVIINVLWMRHYKGIPFLLSEKCLLYRTLGQLWIGMLKNGFEEALR